MIRQLTSMGAAMSLMAIMALSAHAEQVGLSEAVRLALMNSPGIQQAEAGVEKGLSGIDAAKAKQGPTLGVQAQVGVLETDFTQDQISQIPRQIGLQAEWPIYTSGGQVASLAAAGKASDAAGQKLTSRQEQVALQTIEAYAQAWLADRVLDVGQARLDTLEIRFEETNSRFGKGLLTKTDVALTEARLASAEANLEASQARKAAAYARLVSLTGVGDIETISPVGEAAFELPADLEDALREVLASHPDLQAARDMAQAADFQLKATRSNFGPKVSLKARASTGEDVYFFFEDPISDVGAFVTFEMPLFTNGLKAASEREAIAGRSEALANVRATELQLREMVTGLWSEWQARKLALAATERAETAAALAAEGAKKENDAGLRTLVDALDAENAYRDAQIQRYQAEIGKMISEARMLALMSQLRTQLR